MFREPRGSYELTYCLRKVKVSGGAKTKLGGENQELKASEDRLIVNVSTRQLARAGPSNDLLPYQPGVLTFQAEAGRLASVGQPLYSDLGPGP